MYIYIYVCVYICSICIYIYMYIYINIIMSGFPRENAIKECTFFGFYLMQINRKMKCRDCDC